MKAYVKSNLCCGETVVREAALSAAPLVGKWIFGILFCWLLFIPLISAIIATIKHKNIELAITDKRAVGKTGVIRTQSLEAPLSRVQNVSIYQGFWGKVIGYGTLRLDTAAGKYVFEYVKDPYSFKNTLFEQIERCENNRMRYLAAEIAASISAEKEKAAAETAAKIALPAAEEAASAE
ncbi:MAG: PH domain-containing protein [Clostridia bacterium]|nr:PH domain-containing protein [Clostridia bacterium]